MFQINVVGNLGKFWRGVCGFEQYRVAIQQQERLDFEKCTFISVFNRGFENILGVHIFVSFFLKTCSCESWDFQNLCILWAFQFEKRPGKCKYTLCGAFLLVLLLFHNEGLLKGHQTINVFCNTSTQTCSSSHIDGQQEQHKQSHSFPTVSFSPWGRNICKNSSMKLSCCL